LNHKIEQDFEERCSDDVLMDSTNAGWSLMAGFLYDNDESSVL
jgi:hypothetical protein